MQRLPFFFLILAISACAAAPTSAALSLATVEVARDLPEATSIGHAGDGSDRLFVTLQRGRVMVLEDETALPQPFLDVSALVSCCGERGLLGIAFHPEYVDNGVFFLNYTNIEGHTVIARYHVSENPNLADPDSAEVLLTIKQPYGNHNGGQLKFGPDGYLYIGMGDGGSGGDPHNFAQDLQSLLGALLRIDVDGESPYGIPEDNPFVDDANARDEIWAYGLRNPWRFSFDRETGDLFIADVGQGAREEVNLQPADSPGGENYGWRLMEGTLCYNPQEDCYDEMLVLPILEYDHSGGCSITGGYRYRGEEIPALQGTYIFSDYCSGRIWGGTQEGEEWTMRELLQTDFRVSTFGEDERGEVYVADHLQGVIYRLVNEAR